MMSRANADWTDQEIANLRQLWATGLKATEIGHRMGRSKNSITAKAHRLQLSERPAPFKRDAEPRPGKMRSLTGKKQTLASLIFTEDPMIFNSVFAAPADKRQKERAKDACCWIDGEPGTKTARWCDAVALPGKSWCAEHHGRVFAPAKERRDENGPSKQQQSNQGR